MPLIMYRKLSILFILLISACSKSSGPVIKDIVVEDYIRNNYYDDAIQLYLREISQNKQSSAYNTAEIDTAKVFDILQLLQAVHSLNTEETKYIFENRKIHALQCIGTHSIALEVDTEQSGIKQLAKGIIPTCNAPLDTILIKYGFNSVHLSYGYPNFNWLSINTLKTLNLYPVIEDLKKISFIMFAENNGGCFDGDNIKLIQENNSVKIVFSQGDGDCPAGCIIRKYWEYRIKNGIATYLGSY